MNASFGVLDRGRVSSPELPSSVPGGPRSDPRRTAPDDADDVLGSSQDLTAAAAAQLAEEPAHVLEGEVTAEAGEPAVRITTRHLDRVDIVFTNRWIASIDVAHGTRTRRPAAPVPT